MYLILPCVYSWSISSRIDREIRQYTKDLHMQVHRCNCKKRARDSFASAFWLNRVSLGHLWSAIPPFFALEMDPSQARLDFGLNSFPFRKTSKSSLSRPINRLKST